MAVFLKVGQEVWVPSSGDEGFAICTVAAIDNGDDASVTVRDAGGKTHKIPRADVQPVNPDNQAGCKDNTELMYLREPHMLHNLRVRFSRDAIYTYTAHILLAMNPFKKLDLYSEDRMASYAGKSLGLMEPHVFAVADRAYRSMGHYSTSQAAIISGESGSGKTETAKIVMAFLAWAGRGAEGKTGGSGGTKGQPSGLGAGAADLAERVLQANPLLEAFGNARTLRNGMRLWLPY